jgi:NAD/NADP transhydrogenase alpha subunit
MQSSRAPAPLHAPADDTALHWGLVLGSVGVVAVAVGIVLGVVLGTTDVTTVRVTIPGF